jgi:hypothetical protein
MTLIFSCDCGSTVFFKDGNWLYCAICPTKRNKIIARCLSDEIPDNTKFNTVFDAKKSLNNYDVQLVWELVPEATYQQIVDALKNNDDNVVEAVMDLVKKYDNDVV